MDGDSLFRLFFKAKPLETSSDHGEPMDQNEQLPASIQANTTDYVTAGAKAVLGFVPFAGSLLAEIAGTIIPQQRIDRIADFASKLELRIQHLESSTVKAALQEEEFTDLAEEAIRQASRSTTPERREYLASLLASSLTSDAISHAESKHLMRILGELNDVEVIWLRFYREPAMNADQEFRKKHEAVLRRIRTYIGAPRDDLDADALQRSYRDHLTQLGLLTATVTRGKNDLPEFDRTTGQPKVSSRMTSTLGDLLLRQIGLVEHPETTGLVVKPASA